jgi:hypothetical protein
MGWEQRGSGLYYYRKKWRGGRVVSEYVGPGVLGMLATLQDGAKRDRHQQQAGAERKARAEHAAMDAAIGELQSITKGLVAAALEEAGYHQHRRGEWRKRRDKGND